VLDVFVTFYNKLFFKIRCWYGTLYTADDLGILGLVGVIILERLLK
jgi:hypothetical protein